MKTPNGTKNAKNWIAPAVVDQDGKLHLGRFVGTVNRIWYFIDPDYGYGEDSEIGLAYQKINGEIIAVDPKFEFGKQKHVNSLKGVDRVEIVWGVYPKDFPEAWKAVEGRAFTATHKRIKQKADVPPMFEYTVYWHDANGAGEAEEGVLYVGTSRAKALAAKKKAEETSCGGSIDIRLLWKNESRFQRFAELAEWDDDIDNSVIVCEFEDGTTGWINPESDCIGYYTDRFSELHGKCVSCKDGPYTADLVDVEYIVDHM